MDLSFDRVQDFFLLGTAGEKLKFMVVMASITRLSSYFVMRKSLLTLSYESQHHAIVARPLYDVSEIHDYGTGAAGDEIHSSISIAVESALAS